MTLIGTGFYGASAVNFGGVTIPAGSFVLDSDTSISVTVPNGLVAGSTAVSVTTDAGTTGTMPFGVFVAPGEPTGVGAAAGDSQASVSFTAPVSDGGSPISGYTVTSSPGGLTASGTASPIAVTGLTNGTGYTFTVIATNAVGPGAPSAPSNAVTPMGAQTITFDNPGTQHFGTSPTLTASASSGLPVTFTSATTSVCTVTPSGTLSTVSGGGCTIRADQSGDGAFLAAPQVTQSFVIDVPGGAVGFSMGTTLPTATGGTPYSFAITAAGGATPYTFSVTGGAPPDGLILSPTGVLSGTPLASGTFNFSVQVVDAASQMASQTFQLTVNAPTITLSPTTLPNPVVGVAYSQAINATGGSGGYSYSVTAGSLPPGITMTSAGALSGTPTTTGAYNFTVTASDGFGFSGLQAYSMAIGAGNQAIAFAAQAGQTYVPDGTFALNPLATASSGLAVAYSSQTTGVCTIAGSTVTMHGGGTCTIAADQAGDANWSAAPQVTQDIAIAAATQAITGFKANPSAPTYAPNGTFAVSATGGASTNPVVFASTTASVCTVSGSTVTMLAAGTCSLTADQAGDANYTAAPQVTLDVGIGKAAPALSWIADIARTYGDADFDLPDPDSSGSGAFAFASSNAQVATIEGRTVTITGAGTATLTATQAATANYRSGSIGITLTVDARPDPTRDPSVAVGLQAQVDASVRFAQAQQENIRGRLDQLRNGGNASSNAVGLRVQGGIGQPGLSLNANRMRGATPKLANGWGFWSAGSIVVGERDANGAGHGFDFRTDGVTFGIDRLVGDSAAFGVSGGFGWNDDDFDDEGSSLDARQRSLALYGQWHAQSWFVGGILGRGRLDFDIARWSGDAHATATAQRDGDQRFASLTVGYDHRGGTGTLTGYGRVDASRTTLDAYRESGLGIYDLRYARQDVDNSTAALGVQGRYTFRVTRATLQPNWMLEWRQALQDNGDAGINYVVLPRSDDYVLGLRSYNDDTLAFGAGLDMVFGNGWSLSFQVKREQSPRSHANGFGFRVSWGQALRADPYAVFARPDGRAAEGLQPQP